jgi:hypothetical protein
MLKMTAISQAHDLYLQIMLQAKQRLAVGWTVRGSNSDGGEIFRARLLPLQQTPGISRDNAALNVVLITHSL